MTLPARPRLLTTSLSVVLLTALVAAQDRPDSRGGRRSGFRPNRQIVRAADANVDGVVSAEEWAAFLASLGADEEGRVERDEVRARVLVPMLDQDRDARLTLDDLFALFEALDKDVDYAIEASEFPPPSSRGTGAVAPGQTAANLGSATVVLRAADQNADGAVDANEWGLFVDQVGLAPDGTIETPTLVRWMDAEQVQEPTPGAFTSAAILRWVSDELGADQDGAVSLSDLESFHSALDTDEDGTLSLGELAFSSTQFRPSAEDRGRVPLMPWQRNLDDALALSAATGKPLLICVNMDGEMASESLALSRYRDPAFVELARGFVPLLVSPDRHDPRDHDDRGRRIVDAKFGRIVSGEHLDLEPELFERYFDGRRVSPRHLGVDSQGNVLFDIFLVNDLTQVDDALREHGQPGVEPIDPAGMSEEELLASPDALHRDRLETRFLEGDSRTRARLAALALSSVRRTQHPELLRLALRDPEPAVRVQAAWTLAQSPLEGARHSFESFSAAWRTTDLLARDGRTDAAAARAALADALGRIERASGPPATRARATRLLLAIRGQELASEIVEVDRWRVALSWAVPVGPARPESRDELYRLLARLEEQLAGDTDDHELNLAFASATLRNATFEMRDGKDPGLLLEDVLAAAARVLEANPEEARALAFRAWARSLRGDAEGAAADAARALPRLLPWAGTQLAGKALEILATARSRAILAAARNGESWPVAWSADAHAAYATLREHPLGIETQALAEVELLDALGIAGPQERILLAALERFPQSGELNAALRRQLLRDADAHTLEGVYARLGNREDACLRWYDGLAQLAAAERHVENRDQASALTAYLAGADRFRAAPEHGGGQEGSAGHYLCLALAGVARIRATAGDWQLAIEALREGVAAAPESVWLADGLGRTPRDAANEIYRSLVDDGNEEDAAELRDYLREQGLELEG